MDKNNNDGYASNEPPVSEDAFGGDPVLQEFQTEEKQAMWLKELEASKGERKQFINDGNKVIERYASRLTSQPSNDASGRNTQSDYNLFFANTDIKLSALYARTPQPEIKRRFNDADDDVSRVASMLLERNICYELDIYGFDQSIKQTLFDWKVPGLGVMWARYEQAEKAPITDPVTGVPIAGSDIADQQSCLDYVNWADFLWAPCQVWQQCRWVARRIPMDRRSVMDRFGGTAPEDVLAVLTYEKADTAKDGAAKSALDPKRSEEKTVDVYEIWDKETQCIFWITEGAPVPLDVQSDTNAFDQFFPTPLPPLARTTTSNTTPISDFSLAANLYNELDNINKRITNLARALQLKWVYESSFDELKDLYTTTSELEGIPVSNWAAMKQDKGGLAGTIEFTPLADIATTYSQLLAARDQVKQQIYEVEGIADIMRGAVTANESIVATQNKVAFGTSRLSAMQLDVAQYVEALLRLKAHLICKFYTPQTIIGRAGTLSLPDQQLVPAAIQLLKSGMLTDFRLTVSVDSIQLPNWNIDRDARNQAVQVVSSMLAQVIPVAQQSPEVAQLGMELMRFSLAGLKGAQAIEGIVDDAVSKLTAAAGQPTPQPPSPAQLRMQQSAMDNQTQLQIATMQEQTKRLQAQLDAQDQLQDAQLRTEELALRRQKTTIDAAKALADQHTVALQNAHREALDRSGGR